MQKTTKLPIEKQCKNGHLYLRTTSSSTCPICELQTMLPQNWFTTLSKPAQRALMAANITNIHALQTANLQELAKLHGVGPKTIKQLKTVLQNT